MQIGVTMMIPSSVGVEQWEQQVRELEESGIDQIGVGDVQTLGYECFVYLGMLAMSTSRVRIGPVISNPFTRHVGVAANAYATLANVSEGRTFIGLATGNSALRNIGRPPASLTVLRDYVSALRALLSTGRAIVEGRECLLPWVNTANVPQIQIIMAANGPKSLQLAGEIADGVICGGGISDSVLESTFREIDKGLRLAGRSRRDLEIWCPADLYVGEMDAAAWSREANILAAKASRNFRHTLDGKAVPPEMAEPIRRLEAAYSYERHVGGGEPNSTLLDELGLTDFLATRWLLQGDPSAIARRLGRLGELGVSGIQTSGFAMGLPALTSSIRDQLLPALRGIPATAIVPLRET
jgi:5,10-methylenetetrahydromethanopterin reductase